MNLLQSSWLLEQRKKSRPGLTHEAGLDLLYDKHATLGLSLKRPTKCIHDYAQNKHNKKPTAVD